MCSPNPAPRTEALTAEQRDLFQETWASDLAAAEAELTKQAALIATEPALPWAPVLMLVVNRCPIICRDWNISTNGNRVPAANADFIRLRSERTLANNSTSNLRVSLCMALL